MQMVIMTFRSSMEDTVLKWLETEHLSFTFVEKAHGKGKTGHDLGSIYWGGINTMLFAGIQDEQLNGFRESMHNCNGRSLEQPTCQLPFMSLSCLASNGSSASRRGEYPTGYL